MTLPAPPYYAVVFASQKTASPEAQAGYGAAAEAMTALAAQQPGYLGVESARDANGFGITVSYWESLEAISAWRNQAEHAATREKGRANWYAHYELKIAKVERAYSWQAPA